MNNDLNKHKKSDAIKWVVVFVSIFVLLAGMIAALVPLYSKGDMVTDKGNETVVDKVNNSVILTEENSINVQLVSTAIDESDYDDYAVAASSDSAYLLTATVLPESASNKSLNLKSEWVNPSSEWANGKTVDDYLSISLNETNVWVLSVLQPFGEQIKLTAMAHNYVEGDTSAENLQLKASCLVDYVKRVEGFGLTVVNADGTSNITFGEEITVNYYVYYSDGTLQGQFIGGKVRLTLKDALYNACSSAVTSGNWATSQTILLGSLESVSSANFSVGECTRFMSATGNPGTGESQWQEAFLNYITNDHTYHATLSMDWSYAYNGVVYGQSAGTASNSVKFNTTGLTVDVASVALDSSSLTI